MILYTKKENIIFTLYFLFKYYTATFSDSLILSAIIAINSEFVGLPLFEFTVYPNIFSCISIWPLFHATSIACLIALSTLDGVVLNFWDKVGYNSLVTELRISSSCTARIIASLIYW